MPHDERFQKPVPNLFLFFLIGRNLSNYFDMLKSARHEIQCNDRALFVIVSFAGSSSAVAKSSTLPLPHQRPQIINREQRDRERDGYYSDRNELIRERERERDRGYLSDHNSR